MVSLVTDYIQDTAARYLGAGITAVGTLAGNAVGGVGGLIENSGRAVGNGVAGGIGGVGGYINGYGDAIRGSMAADGPVGGTSQRKAVQQTARPVKQLPQKSVPADKGVTGKSSSSLPALKAPPSNVPSSATTTKALPSTKKPATGTSALPRVSTAALSNKTSTGKVTISPESRPRKAVSATTKSAVEQKKQVGQQAAKKSATRAGVQTKGSTISV